MSGTSAPPSDARVAPRLASVVPGDRHDVSATRPKNTATRIARAVSQSRAAGHYQEPSTASVRGMADPRNVVDDLTTKAALAAGKDAARRAVEDLLSSDEEKAQKEAERVAQSKRRRNKLIAYGVVGLILVLGLVGMVLSYWPWFVLAGLVGVAGLYGRHRLRKRWREKREQRGELKAEQQQQKVRLPADRSEALPRAGVEKPRDDRRDEDRELDALALQEARAREAAARDQARVAEENEVDQELAAMKARLKK